MKPTRLYIKEHTATGMKYLGKSIKQDLNTYMGSGKLWLRHINKHGREHVINIWISDWFYDEKEIKEYASRLSKEHNIVESDNWANLKEETGTDGGVLPAYALESISHKLTGRTKETHEYLRRAGEKKSQYNTENSEWMRTKVKKFKENYHSLSEEEKAKKYKFGHKHTEETKKQQSEKRKGLTKDNNNRVRKMSETKKKNDLLLTKEEKYKKYNKTGGMSWFYNDTLKKSILVRPTDVPEGYTKGRKIYNENKEN